jgi:hypothetical protein
LRRPFAVLVTLLLTQPLHAGHGKAGMWELSGRADSSAMRAILGFGRNLPVVETKLKARGVRFGDDGTVLMRYCMTADEVAQDRPDLLHSSSCGARNLQHKGNTFTADVQCRGSLTGRGHLEFTFTSPERYSGHQVMTASLRGLEMTHTVTFEGRWLAAACKGVP